MNTNNAQNTIKFQYLFCKWENQIKSTYSDDKQWTKRAAMTSPLENLAWSFARSFSKFRAILGDGVSHSLKQRRRVGFRIREQDRTDHDANQGVKTLRIILLLLNSHIVRSAANIHRPSVDDFSDIIATVCVGFLLRMGVIFRHVSRLFVGFDERWEQLFRRDRPCVVCLPRVVSLYLTFYYLGL